MKEIITNPSLIALYFFKHDNTNKAPPDRLKSKLALIEDTADHKVFNGNGYQLEWLTYYDTIVLRFYIREDGEFSSQRWLDQQKSLYQIIQDLEISVDVYNFLGSSIVHWGLVDGLEVEKDGTVPPTITKFGNLWQAARPMKEREIAYILQTPRNLEDITRKNFLFAMNYGLVKIESHFHKASTEIREYEKVQEELLGGAKKLDEELVTLLDTLRNKDARKQKETLSEVTQKYISFVEKVSLVNKLQNTLQINIDNYKDRLEILRRENDQVYNFQIKRFERSLNQIKYDLNYCQSTISSVHTGLDLLRGMSSIAIQSRGVSMQAALGVVEIIFVFYYSMGAWHFIIGEEKLAAIPSIYKIMIGSSLAVFVPWGAHAYMNREWKLFATSLVIILIAVIFAVMVTYNIY
ncbi:MAG: hypothetical protein Q7J35_13590 [Candidatus Methanoperedens sp.]|nr:hypothetical protein [Candidatus Methanoperedens sp.]